MQHLENDMDELFQRAAENYPLEKGRGDWESIAKRIADKTEPSAVLAASNNNSTKKITAFLLLFFIAATSWFIFQNHKQEVQPLPGNNFLANNRNEARDKPVVAEKNDESQVQKKMPTVTDKKNRSHQDQYNSIGTPVNNRAVVENGNINTSATSILKNSSPAIETHPVTKKYHLTSSIKNNNNPSPQEDINQKVANNNSIENQDKHEDILIKNRNGDEEVNQVENLNNAFTDKRKKKKAEDRIFQKRKGFYVGIVAGPDFSKVHSGSFDHSGFNAGIVGGYRFNKRLSLESGISWNKKYYTSEGKNFSMDKVAATMPLGMIINNLESNSSFVEIPLKIKFDFLQRKNSDFFIAGGVSAYIITKEQNMYHVTLNGDNKKVLGVYEKNNYGLPAVANLSLGYEKNIFKRVNLRIEPYLKIPLRGMGVGSLPVTSAGLQIGIISRLQ